MTTPATPTPAAPFDPYRAFKFRIAWRGRPVAGVSKVSALKRTTEVVEYREGSDPSSVRMLPGSSTFEAVTLERGVTRDAEFVEWANRAGSDAGGSLADSREDVTVEVLDAAGQVAAAYRVFRCWVSEFAALPAPVAEAAVAIESIKLENEGWERIAEGDLTVAKVAPGTPFGLGVGVDPPPFAHRIKPTATRADLVLPPEVLVRLDDLVRRAADTAAPVGGTLRSGGGQTALFTGASGTGKTLAAEVVASELGRDLLRVDLSKIASHYIGETEKNLAALFDAAATGGSVLLFDEADALFGKRTDVKDSHDRYANIEVSYLLQRIEQSDALVILATNLRDQLDTAFARRIDTEIEFPAPDASSRREIWKRVLAAAPVPEVLDPDKLAQLELTGGDITRVARRAVELAGEAGERTGMPHLLRAARSEAERLGRTLTDAFKRER